VAALCACTLGLLPRNAGTPLAIASTPVKAVEPDAKERRMMKMPSARNSAGTTLGATACGHLPRLQRLTPIASITMIDRTNADVGIAKRAPDSLVPRKFAIEIS